MDAIKVEASADASAGGLAEPYAGGRWRAAAALACWARAI